MYYSIGKLSDLATKVDETELKLFLSGLETTKGNKFSILAYVDIARTQEEVFLYDIKTENVKFLEANRKRHEDQLNLYSKMYYDLYGDPMAKASSNCYWTDRGTKEGMGGICQRGR